MISALIAALHYLALGLGFAGLIIRAKAFKHCLVDKRTAPVFFADNMWGIAALLWIITGLMRAFMGLEKGSEYYLRNHWFYLKMLLFLIIFLIELYPMMTLIKWRVQKKKSIEDSDLDKVRKFTSLNYIETVLTVIIVFIASRMARAF